MKKIISYLMILGLALPFYPGNSRAENASQNVAISSAAKESGSAQARSMILRLEEIKTLSKTNLTQEKRASLKMEVKAIRKNLSQLDGGIYLSVGAVILILIILIIIF